MFIRKALIVYLLLESRAVPVDGPDDWVVDWRWLLEE
jgi:hypothetical protein